MHADLNNSYYWTKGKLTAGECYIQPATTQWRSSSIT